MLKLTLNVTKGNHCNNIFEKVLNEINLVVNRLFAVSSNTQMLSIIKLFLELGYVLTIQKMFLKSKHSNHAAD